LCAVNCAALADDLIEAELFGHIRGAYTGANTDRAGLFEEADGGTLFLDEISELSARGQAKLLRALQEGEVRRLGENSPRKVDVRIVAATNTSLADACGRGRFRQDLFYRLDVVRIGVASLRDRPEDLPILIARFWKDASRLAGSRALLTPEAVVVLSRHDWPGNIRQLQNTLAALAVRTPRVGRIGGRDVTAVLSGTSAMPAASPATLDTARRRFDIEFISAALAQAGGHRARAAADLGVTRQGLAKLIQRLGISLAELPPAVEAIGH
jgi:two-component system response regulator HydG